MVDERSRLMLADAVKQALGDDAGITLMELLPPVGWADVATKHDLLALEERLALRVDARFGTVDSRFAAIESRFDAVDISFDAVDARFERLEHRVEGLDGRMGRLESEVRAQTWKLMTLMVAVVGVVVAAVRL